MSQFPAYRKGHLSVALCAGGAVAIGRAIQVGSGIYDPFALVWLAAGLSLAWLGFLALDRGKPTQVAWFAALGCLVWQIWQLWNDSALGRVGFPSIYDAVVPPILTLAACLGFLMLDREKPTQVAWFAALGCLAWQIWQLWNDSALGGVGVPSIYDAVVPPILTLAAVGALLAGRLSRIVFVPVLVIVHFVAGAWLLSHSRPPLIDVCESTRCACDAFSHGQDPYAIDFPDIYRDHPDWEKAFYPRGWVINGRVQFGYPYMPLSFFVAYAGHLFGDFRFGNLFAITAAGALLAYCRRSSSTDRKDPHPDPLPVYRERGNWGIIAGILLLLTPRIYVIAYNGWSEPTIVLCMALVVFCASGRRRALPWAIGLLMVSKQHMILAAPAVLLLLPKPWRWRTAVPFLLQAMAVSAVVTLPLVLWNFHAFWHSAVQVQLENPFRLDSLNFAALWAKDGHTPPPQWLAFVIAIGAIGVVMRKAPRTTSGFATGVAVIFLSFFALEKQAFGNYYFFVIGALCCAIAAMEFTEQPA